MNGITELETVYRDERSRVLAWLATRVDREEAEDILQDVMTRAFANLDALEPVRDLVSWVWRGVRNGVIDAWRKRSRRRTTASPVDELDQLVDWAFPEVEDEDLYLAIGSLPGDQREVIVAQSLRGESFASLSDRTGVSVETLSARKRRALVRLAEMLT